VDDEDLLKDLQPESEKPPWQKGAEKNKKKAPNRKEQRKLALETAYEACGIGDEITVDDIADYMGVTERTVRNRIKEHGGFEIEEGIVTRKS
jgi:hypothetical protein